MDAHTAGHKHTSTRIIISRHARTRGLERVGRQVNLQLLVSPVATQLDAAVTVVHQRVAWMDAPGSAVPVFVRTAAHRPLVLVTVLRRGFGLSAETRPLYLHGGPP
jgi:hypothetical protein